MSEHRTTNPVTRAPIDVDGMDLGRGVFGIGNAAWNPSLRQWVCLANVNGALCLVGVNVSATYQPERVAP